MISSSNKWAFYLSTLVFVLVVAFSLPAAAGTLVVAKSGAGFNSIQAAIDAAEPGDTVRVQEGVYKENLSVDKDLTLKGAGTSKVKIDGQKEGYPVLKIGPSEVEVTVKDLTLQGAERNSSQNPCKEEKGVCPIGLVAGGNSETKVKGVTISGNWFGFFLEGSARALVENSKISGNGESGIALLKAAHATIENSKVTGNKGGITLLDFAQATINNSEISGNGKAGVTLSDSVQAKIGGNVVSENGVYGICLLDSAQATIKRNMISQNGLLGVLLSDSAQATVKSNRVSGNAKIGIGFGDSASATVRNNKIRDNKFGIGLGDLSRATVENNEVTENKLGISLEDSTKATVQSNSLQKNDTGIKIYEPEKFKGTLKGSGNRLIDNDTDFVGVSESTREELVS